MADSLFTLIYQLPIGILLAAGLLELFVLQKDRRELEPAVLWLLCCSALVATGCAVLHFLLKGRIESYTGWQVVAAGLATVGFWFKRQARNRGVLKLTDRFYVGNSYSPVRVANQAFYIFGYRMALGTALVTALAGVLVGGVLPKVAKTPTGGNALAQNSAPAPVPPAVVPAAIAPQQETPKGENSVVVAANPPAESAPQDAPASEAPKAPENAPSAPAASDNASPAPTPTLTGNATAPAPTPTPGAAPTPVAVPVSTVPKTAPAVAESRPVSKNSLYATRVRPIIQKYCVTCHGSSKQKGDVRLDSPDFIRHGAEGKPIILAGKAESSSFYNLIVKPAGDPDRMPPKGDGVSAADAAFIKKWIDEGADMGDGVMTANGAVVALKTDALAKELQLPPAALIEELTKEGVAVRKESPDGKLINLVFSYAGYREGELKLERLIPIAQNIYGLDLSRTVTHDADLSILATMQNLHTLDLSRTDIGDAGVQHLKALAKVEKVNLYQTKVTDAGLKHLEGLTTLKSLYTWQSMVTPAGADSLKKSIAGLEVNTGK